MSGLFEFLFKYSPYLYGKGQFVMGATWPALAVLAAGTAATLWSYARARAGMERRDRVVLAALRLAALAVLFFCLCQPVLVLSTAVPQQIP